MTLKRLTDLVSDGESVQLGTPQTKHLLAFLSQPLPLLHQFLSRLNIHLTVTTSNHYSPTSLLTERHTLYVILNKY